MQQYDALIVSLGTRENELTDLLTDEKEHGHLETAKQFRRGLEVLERLKTKVEQAAALPVADPRNK
jgi:hypothetical protein